VHHALGEVHRRTGRYDAALRHYRAALAVAPDFARAHLSTGHALASSGRPEAALEHYDAAGRLAPEDAELWFVRANAERRLQRIDAARASYERAIALAPHDVRNHTNMAVLLIEERRFRAAAAALRRARRCRPDSDAVARNLGSLLMRCGRARLAKRAFATARRCAEAAGGARGAPAENHHSAYLHAAAYADDHDPAAYLAQARAWTTVAGVTPTTMPARVPAAAREVRRLRVGYLTGALHEAHPLASFVEAIFGAYDPHRQEVFVYANLGKVDAFTTRQRRRVTGWRDIAPLSDAAACERIRADGLDVLVDLGGHLQRHRMGVVARRVAPAQAHYLGYFASTGVPAVDYWIADDVLIPPAHEAYFSETVWRLDRPWLAYDGDPTLPVAGAGDTARPVRLGTFNALVKVTPATVALWARVLHALPAAELFLKTKELADHGNRTRLVRAFARHGIDSARLRLADRNNTPDRHAHMCAYHGLDVALDPVGGVSGATTTCDALWMGVPVVTLPGPHTGGRLSTALLHAVGHEEWVAEDEAAYVATVRALVRDGARSADARGALRAEMAGSHLCDARGLARALDDAYAAMAATGAPAAGDAR
jgi:predicted O-linked N-acetylglucosamine transferase (SPINDLY family)